MCPNVPRLAALPHLGRALPMESSETPGGRAARLKMFSERLAVDYLGEVLDLQAPMIAWARSLGSFGLTPEFHQR
jgi:hypothetical protein